MNTAGNGQVLYFWIPLSDIGDAKFYVQMDAKLLIRYIRELKATEL